MEDMVMTSIRDGKMLVRAAESGNISVWTEVVAELQKRGLLEEVCAVRGEGPLQCGLWFALRSSNMHVVIAAGQTGVVVHMCPRVVLWKSATWRSPYTVVPTNNWDVRVGAGLFVVSIV